MTKPLYSFDAPIDDAARLRLLGGKALGLHEMTSFGLPVPPGFTLTTEVGAAYRKDGHRWPSDLAEKVDLAISRLEKQTGRDFGGGDNPLFLSVRSGAAASMPGMMDTVLNLGLNDESAEALALRHGDRRFALDAYRRLLQMFGDVVLDVPHDSFENALAAAKQEIGSRAMRDAELSEEALESLVATFKSLIADYTGDAFPQDAKTQLWGAIGAVFRSWENRRAVRYRLMQGIDDSLGTACTVQAMVFGNLNDQSGSGVAFTRNPSTGQRELYGEFLSNAQGEDVVSGMRTPSPLTKKSSVPGREESSFEHLMPDAFASLVDYCSKLETHFKDVQDIEFTIEDGRLFVLQTRAAKRTPQAAVRTAVAMVDEEAISKEEALAQIDAGALSQILHARVPSPEVLSERGVLPFASGLPASPGAASGRIVFTADDAERLAVEGQRVVLVRHETSPEDVIGMKASQAVLTAAGGMTSHAAVVARGLAKCCVVGCVELDVDVQAQTLRGQVGTETLELKSGDLITVDGHHGKAYAGELEVVAAPLIPEFDTLSTWVDDLRQLGVRANADTPSDVRTAMSYGAEGIGLCRTEHMFFAHDRLKTVRCAMLADCEEERQPWLVELEAMQRKDFIEIFEAVKGRPVTIRLLDWPLHEFMPSLDSEFEEIAEALDEPTRSIKRAAEQKREVNPMLGHRGGRLGVTTLGMYRMQVRAILKAALEVSGKGMGCRPEILLPFIALESEVVRMRALVEDVAAEITAEHGQGIAYELGAMIELPAACLIADAIAEHVSFLSFGTNDLTQTSLGLSCDDAAKFIPAYIAERGILKADPFAVLHRSGVGELMRLAVERARNRRPGLSIGLCGEHGGEPSSVAFAVELGLSYVSCSPPRLPVARLAAAQAILKK